MRVWDGKDIESAGREWRDEAAVLDATVMFSKKAISPKSNNQVNHIWDLMRQRLDWPFVSAGLWERL